MHRFHIWIILIVCILTNAFGLEEVKLFPHGSYQGDSRLPTDVDDVSSPEFHLKTPIVFFDKIYESIYINSNGLLSFLTDIPSFFNIQFPLDYPVIAPFYSDVDTRAGGGVFYRETQSDDVVKGVSNKIKQHFSSGQNFKANNVLIITWDRVGYYNSKNDQVNTFQVVIATNGQDSYVLFMYSDIQWIYGEGKSSHPDARAQAGFMSGDGRVHLLIGSGSDQIRNIYRISNVGDKGLWMYRIGNVGPNGNIQEPDLELAESAITLHNPQSCSVGAAFCHRYSKCVDYNPGFCCQCSLGYYGNGKNCLQDGVPQRFNGKVSGILNGEKIEDVDLHSYVVTLEGRAYTAISRIGSTLGFDMQTLLPLGGIIGWLFAIPHGKALNGYKITGGVFNHTVNINFPNTGQHVTIKQMFMGLDVFNHLRLASEIHGTTPSIPLDNKIEIDDYEEEYTRISEGTIKSHSNRNYRLENSNINTPFTIDQTITYEECTYAPVDVEMNTLRLKVARNYIIYDPREQVIRYAVTNKITPLTIENPCKEGLKLCGPDSSCVVEGDSYRCVCNPGYDIFYQQVNYEEVAICLDINECTSGKDNCNINADCINQPGSFICRCFSGYTGDGVTCQKLLTCDDLRCDENAECIRTPSGRAECRCKFGYQGNGLICIEQDSGAQHNCRDDDICDPNADCILNLEEQNYFCQCLEGYIGNGITCYEEIESCNVENNCHPHASCIFINDLQTYSCICNQGYRGDGYNCVPETFSEECNVLNNCHPHAQCIYDTLQSQYFCRCNAGYEGNGYSCTPKEVTCDQVNICSLYGHCAYDVIQQKYLCRCNDDYEGDGISCSPIDDCRSDQDCDRNARCILDNVRERYRCQCSYGYVGNGRECTVTSDVSCNVINNCDQNARCMYDSINLHYRCQCNSGYQGDGTVCEPLTVSCNIHNNCHPDADCSYDTLEQGYRCQCHEGFVGDGLNCVPSRSCLNDPSICHPSADCVIHANLDHYVCQCRQGYQGDGYICNLIPVHEGNFLLVNQGMATLKFPLKEDMKEKARPLVLIPHQTAVGIDVDCTSGQFYWTDITGGAIKQANYEGLNVKTFLQNNIISPECLAVDWVSRNLFWTDSGKDTIEVAKLDTQERKVLFSDKLVNPRGIAVHPGRGKIFWTDWNRSAPKIETGSMDGVSREIFVEDNLGLPNSLTIDYEKDDLCWADAGTQKIECIGLHGHNRRTAIAPVSYPFGITNNRDTIFWTDWESKSIQSASKVSYNLNKPSSSPLGGNSKLYGIVVVPERCPRVTNPCALNNGGCRYLCLPNGHGGRTCVCPDSGDKEEIDACNEIS